MKIHSTAISMTVAQASASSQFLQKHFGFHEQWNAEGFAYLTHEGIAMSIIFLEVGNEVLPERIRHQEASGVIIAFVVDDVEEEERRLRSQGVEITSPLQEDPWGERLFQITDPNGVVIQLVQWVEPSDAQYVNNAPGSQAASF